MKNLNSVLIEGVLAADPDVRQLDNGKTVCNFQIASDRYYTRGGVIEKETSRFTVSSWGRAAEETRGYGKEGVPLRVRGYLKEDRWTDKNGKEHSKVVIVAERVEINVVPQEADTALTAAA
jgi:single-strand DNA-binding protein